MARFDFSSLLRIQTSFQLLQKTTGQINTAIRRSIHKKQNLVSLQFWVFLTLQMAELCLCLRQVFCSSPEVWLCQHTAVVFLAQEKRRMEEINLGPCSLTVRLDQWVVTRGQIFTLGWCAKTSVHVHAHQVLLLICAFISPTCLDMHCNSGWTERLIVFRSSLFFERVWMFYYRLTAQITPEPMTETAPGIGLVQGEISWLVMNHFTTVYHLPLICNQGNGGSSTRRECLIFPFRGNEG